MHLVYVDDSKDGGDLAVMGAVILNEASLANVERFLAHTIENFVPEDLRGSFEFHASALFNAKPPFESVKHDTAIELISRVASIIEGAPLSVIYGAVNLRWLRESNFATSQSLDVAFRSCLEGIEKWFVETSPADEIGMLICDDSSNQQLKKNFRESYRLYRGHVVGNRRVRCGLADYIHDDMYFGDSASSVGLQVADICSYIILRHLQEKQDTEFLYDMIKGSVYFSKMHDGASSSVTLGSLAPLGPA